MTRRHGEVMVVERDLMVTARDGVGLGDRCLPPAGRRRRFRCCSSAPRTTNRRRAAPSAPLRSRTPRSRAEVAAYFVRHGYAVVYQDCRGRYQSEGRFTKYLSEAEDGYDTLAWLLRQLGAMAGSELSVSPMRRIPRPHSAVSTRRGWPRSFSIAAASRTPIAAASARAARSI